MTPAQEIQGNLTAIYYYCAQAMLPGISKKKQQESSEAVQGMEMEVTTLIRQYQHNGSVSEGDYNEYIRLLLSFTYDFHQREKWQNFGVVTQPITLPRDSATEENLHYEDSTDVTQSAHTTRKARLLNGGLVFCKSVKPEDAQLEIVMADFARQTLGTRCTSHGRVIVDSNSIKGMYVETIPGFVSMRELTDMAATGDPYNVIFEKIKVLEKKIKGIQEKITYYENIRESRELNLTEAQELTELTAELQEKNNSLGTYNKIGDLKFNLFDMGTKTINFDKISGIIAKALCTGFLFQDWDRHKDNFGLSFKDGTLDVASLDYDKSLSGIFANGKNFDWGISAQRLNDFPQVDPKVWYWPTSSNRMRSFGTWLGVIGLGIATIITCGLAGYHCFLKAKELVGKTPKMYTKEEAIRFSAFNKDPEFQKQAHIEWLKNIFTPKALRESSVNRLASENCDPRLRATPGILDGRRKELLSAAVQIKSFRDGLDVNIKEALEQFKGNLSSEEQAIVNREQATIERDIRAKCAVIEDRERQLDTLGYHQLLVAVQKSGISFSADVPPKLPDLLGGQHDKVFQDALKSITEIVLCPPENKDISSADLSKELSKQFRLNISKEDARKIKEEIYLKRLCETLPPALGKELREGFDSGQVRISAGSFPPGRSREKTLDGIRSYESAIIAYKQARNTNADKKIVEELFQDVAKSLRALVSPKGMIVDEKLRRDLNQLVVQTNQVKSEEKKEVKDVDTKDSTMTLN